MRKNFLPIFLLMIGAVLAAAWGIENIPAAVQAGQDTAMTIDIQDEESVTDFLALWTNDRRESLINSGIDPEACTARVLAVETAPPLAAVFFELENTAPTDGPYDKVRYMARFEQIDAANVYVYTGSGFVKEPFDDSCILKPSGNNPEVGELQIFFAGDNREYGGRAYSFEYGGRTYTYPLPKGYVLDIHRISPANSTGLNAKVILDENGAVMCPYF